MGLKIEDFDKSFSFQTTGKPSTEQYQFILYPDVMPNYEKKGYLIKQDNFFGNVYYKEGKLIASHSEFGISQDYILNLSLLEKIS